MKKIAKKSLALLLALCMLASVLAACNTTKPQESTKSTETTKTAETTKPTETEADPLAERVDLVCWLLGDAPADMAKVEEKINEILLEKINATITFNFTTWTDFIQKYNLLLSSGESIDLIFSTGWMNYREYAKDGAYLPLDDLLDTYMPKIKAMGEERGFWDVVSVDGAIYGIPLFQSEYANRCLIYRKDLCDKYNLPIPDTIENCEAYLQGIKENMPDQVLTNPAAVTGIMNTFQGEAFYRFYNPNTLGAYGLQFSYDDPNGDYVDYFASEEFKSDMERAKAWAAAGFWPKNSVTQQSPGSIEDGGNVLRSCNPTQYIACKVAAAENHPDWELGIILGPEVAGGGVSSLCTDNCTSIPLASENPERAAMAIELLMTDETLNHLLLYGIEGEHYTVDANGFYVKGPNNDSYIFEGSNAWNFRNDAFNLIREEDQELYEIFDRIEAVGATMKYPNLDIGGLFGFDDTNVKAEVTAVQNVFVEYYTPLLAGMVEDVDAGIEEFRKQLEVAGIEKVREEWLKQWYAFCEENNFD